MASQFRAVVAVLGYDPTPARLSLKERFEPRRRAWGMTFSRAALHLGWDTGSLTRYVNGTWRMSDERAAKLKAFLAADPPSR